MKVLNDYLVDLRTDLKDSGAVWTDAELTRCVERAVADLTRFLPLEKSAELIADATIEDESFTTPAAEDTDYFVTTMDISASVDGNTCTLAAASPDVPRPVKITVTDANTSITELVIIVKGYDDGSKYMEEHFFLAGGLIQTGVKYFAIVTEIELDKITGNGTSDTLIVGTASHLGVFVPLAHKPIKFQSDAITGCTRYTDYKVNYYSGSIALESGGAMTAATAYTINYTRSTITVDVSFLKDLIRIERVEYPAGSIPQELSTKELWGTLLTLTSQGFESQAGMSDNEHVIIHYLAQHQPPAASSPGTYLSFLDWTVELAASAYALFIEALQYEQQAIIDLASVRTALTNVAKYLDNNTGEDAAAILKDITDDVTELRDKARVAADAINAYLDEVDVTDLADATDGAERMLSTGHPLINQLNDGEDVPALYADYARANTQIAMTRIQAAAGYAQELAGRLSDARLYLEQSGGYTRIAENFAVHASQYQDVAANNMLLADRFRAEAIERRNEAWAIWASPSQFAPQYTLAQRGQLK